MFTTKYYSIKVLITYYLFLKEDKEVFVIGGIQVLRYGLQGGEGGN